MIQEASTMSGNSTITFSDMIPLFNKYYKEPISDRELLAAFKKLDENNMGFITADRLRLLMASCSERMTEEEIELFIKNAKPDSDGRIDYNEFVRMMTSI
jgi:Ca2+-binding EF-hand superfamily protein